MVSFQKATKKAAKLRLALIGPAGSGKTWTALSVATTLDGPVALVDTEKGSASKYADSFAFDVLELDEFHPQKYVEAIRAAAQAGYKVLVIDSLSHAWTGKGGALELHDAAVDRQRGSKNAFAAWREVTPHHNALVEAIVQAPLHIIATMRAKTEYVQEKDERTGKTNVRKVGLAPVQRDGLEYEFDVVGDLDQDHKLVIGKTRCPALNQRVMACPGADLAEILKGWLGGTSDGSASQLPTLPASSPHIDRNQAAIILDLIKQTGTDPERFCAAYGVDTPEHLPADKYADAEAKLRRKLGREVEGQGRPRRSKAEMGSGKAAPGQVDRIAQLFVLLDMAGDVQADLLQEYGAETIEGLAIDKAAALLEHLGKLTQQEAQGAA